MEEAPIIDFNREQLTFQVISSKSNLIEMVRLMNLRYNRLKEEEESHGENQSMKNDR
jgi:hypothetical protein